MRILVVGGGGREHAIACTLAKDTETELYSVMAKRNPGIDRLSRKTLLCKETEIPRITAFAKETGVEYAFIGPEAPLEAGIVDALEPAGISCIGPTKAAARLETDKAFCRELMESERVEGCPKYRVFHDKKEAIDFIRQYDGDLAIKPIGLTGGKGVRIMGEQVDRAGAIEYASSISGGIVLEERLIGEEFTLQAFVDGKHIIPMPLVQDHKRAYDGDVGPNTGGMGSYSLQDHRLPFVSSNEYDKALSIMRAIVAAMERTGQPYKGILYGQFMNTSEGPKVIEFNARFGDPEAMNVLSLLNTSLSDIVQKIVDGTLTNTDVSFEEKATVCKYVVPKGYPDTPHPGDLLSIKNYGEALLYYANVEEQEGSLVTLTSRTLAFVGKGDTLEEAEKTAERAASSVSGNVRHRKDVGTRQLLEKRIMHMESLR